MLLPIVSISIVVEELHWERVEVKGTSLTEGEGCWSLTNTFPVDIISTWEYIAPASSTISEPEKDIPEESLKMSEVPAGKSQLELDVKMFSSRLDEPLSEVTKRTKPAKASNIKFFLYGAQPFTPSRSVRFGV